MRILITGASGYIGFHLSQYLVAKGYEVWCQGYPGENKPAGRWIGEEIEWDVMPRLTAVIHLAAITDTTCRGTEAMYWVNCTQAVRLFEQALQRGAERVIYASSAAVYGRGPLPMREDGPLDLLNPYAESKRALERAADYLASKHGKPLIGLRLSNVAGGHGQAEAHKGKAASMVRQLLEQVQYGSPVLYRYGEQSRDWVDVRDVCKAFELALGYGRSGIFNVGSGVSTTFNRLVELINGIMGTREEPQYIPNPYRSAYQEHTLLDLSKSRAELGYEPEYPIEDTILDLARSCGF